MAKITRKTASIFAGSASPAPNGIAQFGSLAASAAAYSTDPATIQALSEWLAGWNSALVSGAAPAIEDMNAVHYVFGYQLAYLLQQGIAEWDAGTTYYTNGFCSYNGVIYQSLADANLNNTPSLDGAYWVPFNSGIAPWNAIVSYSVNDFVTYGGMIYVSLQNTNLNNVPAPGSAYWLPYSSVNSYVWNSGGYFLTASANYGQGMNNSLALGLGTWEIFAAFSFGTSTVEVVNDWAYLVGQFYAANGADSGAEPAPITSIAGLTVKSSFGSGILQDTFLAYNQGLPSPYTGLFSRIVQAPPLIVALTTPTTLYFVPQLISTSFANMRMICQLTARQVSFATS